MKIIRRNLFFNKISPNLVKQDLSLKCSAWKSLIPSLQWMFQSPNYILGQNKFLVQKYVRSTSKFFCQKKFGPKKNFGSKLKKLGFKFFKKMFGSEFLFWKILGLHFFLKKCLVQKKVLVQNKFWDWKNFWVILGRKIFWGHFGLEKKFFGHLGPKKIFWSSWAEK